VTLPARLAGPGESVAAATVAPEVEGAPGTLVAAGSVDAVPALDVGATTGSGIQNGTSRDVARSDVIVALNVVVFERCSSDSSGTSTKLAQSVTTMIPRRRFRTAVLVSVSPFSRGIPGGHSRHHPRRRHPRN
jgi:hypothetical protein